MKNSKIFEMYIKELVKNTIREELKTMLPEMIEEQFGVSTSMKKTPSLAEVTGIKKAPSEISENLDRASIVNIMKQTFDFDGEVLKPSSVAIPSTPVQFDGKVINPAAAPDYVKDALTKDYSQVLKKMKI